MTCLSVPKVRTLTRSPRRLLSGVRTLCIALLISTTPIANALADCPASPGGANDLLISFLQANTTQAAPASMYAATNKEGMLVYDNSDDALKICDGNNWIEVGSGAGGSATASGPAGYVQITDGTNLTHSSETAGPQFFWDFTNHRPGGGTGSPSAPLEGGGAIKVPNDVGGGLILGRSDNTNEGGQIDFTGAGSYPGWFADVFQDSFRIFNLASGPRQVELFSLTGTVGLSVQSGIQLGDDTAVCPGASHIKGGPLRFNTGALQVCLAGGWSGVGSGGGGSAIGFIANSSQSLTSTLTTIANFTETRDDGNGFNPTTGIFTAPTAGYYAFSATAFHSNTGSGDGDLTIQSPYVGTICRQFASPITAGNVYRSCAGVAYLTAGSTAYVQAKNGGGTTAASVTFNGSALGAGGGSGSSTLAGLTDVSVASPADGQSLVYNGTTSKWEPQTITGGGGSARMASGTFNFSHVGSPNCTSPANPCLIDISSGGFTSAPNCVVSLWAGDASGYTENMVIQNTTATTLSVWKGNYQNEGTTMIGNWVCTSGNGLIGGGTATPAGSTGDVQFNTAGALDADTGQLFWDKTNHRLGIGTTTPSQRLDVLGNLNLGGSANSFIKTDTKDVANNSAVYIQTAGTANSFFIVEGTGASSRGVIIAQNGGEWGPSQTIIYHDGDDGVIASGAGDLVMLPWSGNVGIGTTDPKSRLHVSGGVQLGDDTDTCPGASNVKLGTLRFNSGALQVCLAGGWSAAGSGGGSEISASIYRNNAQSIPSSAWHVLTMEAAEWDTSNMADISTNPSRITIPSGQAGRYLVTAYTAAGTNATGGRWLSVYKNGVLLRYCSFPASATLGGVQTITCSWALNLAAGDYLELAAYQSSGGALHYVPRFAVSKLSGGGGGGGTATAAGDSGEIQFNDGSDALAADAALHWDNTNKRLGIGTATPTQRLEVVNRIQATDAGGYILLAPGSSSGIRVVSSQSTVNAGVILENDLAQTAALFIARSGLTNPGDMVLQPQTADKNILLRPGNGLGGGGVAVTTANTMQSSAMLEVASTTKGFLPPRMTTAQRDAIASPAEGLTVYNTTTDGLETFSNGYWQTGAALRNVGRGTSGDYDTIIQNSPGGIWWMDGPGSTNGPTGTNSGTLVHLDPLWNQGTSANKYAIQLATNGNNGNKLFFRHQYNGAWGSWVDLTSGGGGGSPAGNDGSIQLKSGSNFGADAANLHWDDTNNRLGIGTTAPRSPLHVYNPPNTYSLFASGQGVGTNAWTGTETIPIASSQGMDGYTGVALIPDGWGNTGTADSHTVLYLAGAQRNAAAVSSSIAFANWGYFTGTGTGAGGLGNATAQGDAVKFDISLRDNGGEFDNMLLFRSRSASNANANVLSLLSNGNVGIGTMSPGAPLDVQGAGPSVRLAQFLAPNQGNGLLSQIVVGKDGTTNYAQGALTYTYNSTTPSSSYVSLGNSTVNSAMLNVMGNGNVGIGTTSPGYLLDVDGAMRAATYLYTSDRRLKSDIETVSGLEVVSKLHGVSFRWRSTGKPATGVIAQEVESVLPAAVSTDAEGMKSVDYLQLIGPMIEAIKDLKADNDNLRKELATANDNDRERDARIDELRVEIDSLKRPAREAR